MIVYSEKAYGRDARNQIENSYAPGVKSARALVESFYYAFNQPDLEVFSQVWTDHELIQLNNPLGGILRGYAPNSELYQRIFTGSAIKTGTDSEVSPRIMTESATASRTLSAVE